MVNPFISGSGSFDHHLEKEFEDDYSQCSSPSKLTSKKPRKSSLSRSRNDRNPYARRGLDKFSALLAEVEDKKRMIYTQIPSDDISLVRFTFSDTNTIKPIVVKASNKKQMNKIKDDEKEKIKAVVDSKEASGKHLLKSSTSISEAKEASGKQIFKSSTSISEAKQGITNDMKNFSFKKTKIDLQKPSFLPTIVILVLLLLAFFGRSFAILCISIGWYLVPTMKKGSSYSKEKTRRKGIQEGLVIKR